MRVRRSVLVVVAITATATTIGAGCTHDFGAFVVEDDAAVTISDAGGASDGAVVLPEAALDGPACGSVSFNGHCYFAAPAQASFDASQAACVAASAHLVTIESAAEQAIVAPIVGTSDRWIGLERAADAGATSASSFSWITGDAITYANWAATEPNGTGPCVRMKSDGTWGDQTCTTSLAAICERE